jgi:hypothetical protein
MDLSGPLKAALPRVLALARETVAGWLGKSVAEETACLAAK